MNSFVVRYGGRRGKRTFAIEESPNFLAVRVRKGQRATRAQFANPANRTLAACPPTFFARTAGVEVIDVGSRTIRDAFRKTLAGEIGVRFAGRVLYEKRSRRPVLYTENFFVKFGAGVTTAKAASLLERHGLRVARALPFAANSYFVKAPEGTGLKTLELQDRLYRHSEVELCHPELILPKSYRTANPNQWHLKQAVINGKKIDQHAHVEDAWQLSRGEGITIAVIDDGVDVDHIEFRSPGKVVAPRDATADSDDPRPGDEDHHGTACGGVACAEGIGSPGASGVAPLARLMPIRLASDLGSIEEAEAFYWAADKGADVISCSWGPRDGDPFDPDDPLHHSETPLPDSTRLAIDHAIKKGRGGKGCVITWAAGNGNESVDNDGYASCDKVIAVAACNDCGVKSDYSDFGKAVWCAFPSSQIQGGLTPGIWTTDRLGKAGYNTGETGLGDKKGNYTNDFGGTSSACPGVAGVAALVLAANPRLRWNQVKKLLADTSDRIDTAGGRYNQQGRSLSYGYGRVNARRAVAQAVALAHGADPKATRRTKTAAARARAAIDEQTVHVLARYVEAQEINARNIRILLSTLERAGGIEE
jgi:subtilisin family serine protease